MVLIAALTLASSLTAHAQEPDEAGEPAETTEASQPAPDKHAQVVAAAEKGDAKAMSYLGDDYELGRGVKPDHMTALAWYGKAVKAGDGEAAVRLARLNERGYLVSPPATTKIDLAAAAQWYAYGRKLGEPKAATGLANLYFQGKGVKKDQAAAISLYHEAADKDPDAQFSLGEIYLSGSGVKQDTPTGIGWLTKAGEKGHQPSAKLLAKFYREGKVVKKDLAAAMKWSGVAAETGDVPSMMDFAAGWWRGDAGTVDLIAADEWFETAAALGSEGAGRQRQSLAQQLTAAEVAEARRRAQARLARLKGNR